ncbi:unnamed protein product [Owenia fusiformis]|uniref:Uncharacterized protein n=1 Tax=Owenia fusiformis TaxID=6347 RepID=A0A8J1XU79_OWEFU|nr:unnamed protein product [Owenia fusiformis]
MRIPSYALIVGTLAIVIQTVSGRCPSLGKWTKKSNNGEISYSKPPASGKAKKAEYDTDVKVTYTCIDGYELYPKPKNGKGVRKCHKQGYWTEVDYACIFIIGGFGSGPCGSPPVVPNGVIAWAADDRSAVRYACASGYRMEGYELVVCEMKSWSPRNAPTCKAMQPCKKNMCLNGGTCWENPTIKEGFECECPDGHFKGLRCEATKSSTKKGLAVSLSRMEDCRDFEVFKDIKWWYDWSLTAKETKGKIIQKLNGKECKPSDLTNLGERVPMIFTLHYGDEASNLKQNLMNKEPGESNHVLGYNEPNHKNQANVGAVEAAMMWMMKVVQPAKEGGRKLVTPSASICGTDESRCTSTVLQWFNMFMDMCIGCEFDYLATHYFGCNASYVMYYLEKLHDQYNLDIWLTELSCPREDDPDVQLQFMKEILPKLEAAPWINRYAWYTWRLSHKDTYIKKGASLLHERASQLTKLGRYYDNYEPHI